MTPNQIAELRADVVRLTAASDALLLRRMGSSAPLIRASLRVLGWDWASLFADPLAGVADEDVATLASLLHLRLTELGAGAAQPTSAEIAAALAAFS